MKIFLAHATAQKRTAELLFYALSDQGHRVFFDVASLPAGETFDARIHNAIESARLFVFLATKESLDRSSYAWSEFEIAQGSRTTRLVIVLERGLDLPVELTRGTEVFSPAGNVVAASAYRIASLARSRAAGLVRRAFRIAIVTVLASAVAGRVYAHFADASSRFDAVPAQEILSGFRLKAAARGYSTLTLVKRWTLDQEHPQDLRLHWADLAPVLDDADPADGDLLLAGWAPLRAGERPPAISAAAALVHGQGLIPITSLTTTVVAGDLEEATGLAQVAAQGPILEWAASFGAYIGSLPDEIRTKACHRFPLRPPRVDDAQTGPVKWSIELGDDGCPALKWPVFANPAGPSPMPLPGEQRTDTMRRLLGLPSGPGVDPTKNDDIALVYSPLPSNPGPMILTVLWARRQAQPGAVGGAAE